MSSPVGLWEDEDGDVHEIRRRPHGYVVQCQGADGEWYPTENVRWRRDQLKWSMSVPSTEHVLQYETLAIELHTMRVRWKSQKGQGEETFKRISA